MTRCPVIALLVVSLAFAARAAEAPPAAADIPQLKVLDRYLGPWEGKMLIKQGPWVPQEQTPATTATGAKVLAGRYVQINAASTDGVEGMILLTFDVNLGHYVAWRWNSRGASNTTRGDWDEQAKTMTWKGALPNDRTVTSIDRFPDDDTREFQTVVKDAAGAVLLDMSGRVTRKK